MLKKLLALLIAPALGVFGFAQPAISGTPISVNLEPNVIAIGALFSGAQTFVSGMVPADSEVVVIVSGRKDDLTLKKKGRAFGLVWMNLDSVTFHQAPVLYLVQTSKALEDLSRSDPSQWQKLGVGLECLKERLEITPDPPERDALCREFLKLKENEGLYAVRGSDVVYGAPRNGMKTFEVGIDLPSRVSPGEYEVKVLTVENGAVVGSASQNLKVKEVGVPAMLSSLSFQHGSLYGLLAVLAAIGAGLLMNFIFGESKGAH